MRIKIMGAQFYHFYGCGWRRVQFTEYAMSMIHKVVCA